MPDPRRLDRFRSYILAGKGEDEVKRRAVEVVEEMAEEVQSRSAASAAPRVVEFPPSLGLTDSEAKVLRVFLCSSGTITSEQLLSAIYGSSAPQSSYETVKTFISRIKPKLEAVGIKNAFQTIYGVGMSMPDDARAKLAMIVDEYAASVRATIRDVMKQISDVQP